MGITGNNVGIFETKDEQASKRIFADFLKEMHEETDGLDDNNLLGYAEAILNLAGEFTNGHCEECPFSGMEEIASPDFITPEYGLTCSLNECWIDRIKKLIWKEQEQIRKSIKTMTIEILEKAYDEIIVNGGYNKARLGRVAMDELYKHIRKNYIKKLTIAQFKEFMQEVYDMYPLGDFSFEHGSSIRAEASRYGFVSSKKPPALYFYMHKQKQEEP